MALGKILIAADSEPVADGVMRHASCPVLIVRAKE